MTTERSEMKTHRFLIAGVSLVLFVSEAPAEAPATAVGRQAIRIPPQKFQLPKLPPLAFRPFGLEDFKLRNGDELVRLKNGTTMRADEFLKEVNEIEKRLNASGHTLRDNRPIKIQFDYPKDQLRLQRESLLRSSQALKFSPPSPCPDEGAPAEDAPGAANRPKDFVPLQWERNWDAGLGDHFFGARIAANMKMEGLESELIIQPFFLADVSVYGFDVSLLRMEKRGDALNVRLLGRKERNYSLAQEWNDRVLLDEPFEWTEGIGFELGPIEVSGKLKLNGRAKLVASQKKETYPRKATGSFAPSVWAKLTGKLVTDFKIAEAGMTGEVLLVDEAALLSGNLELLGPPNRRFKLSASGRNKASLLKGRLVAYAEIDYLLGTKRFEAEIFDFDGFSFDHPLFSVQSTIAAEKDHQLWLKLNQISGITPHTARNEDLGVTPTSFEVAVEIGGRRYFRELKDVNRDGRYGNVLGEREGLRYEVPLLSFRKVPITVEVVQRYRIGSFDFKDALDLAPAGGHRVELCYDPRTRSLTGTVIGAEDEEIRAVGDSTYWGERYHQIVFEFTPQGFSTAPAKAK